MTSQKYLDAVRAALVDLERESGGQPVSWSAWEGRARPTLPRRGISGGSLQLFLNCALELEDAGAVVRVRPRADGHARRLALSAGVGRGRLTRW